MAVSGLKNRVLLIAFFDFYVIVGASKFNLDKILGQT